MQNLAPAVSWDPQLTQFEGGGAAEAVTGAPHPEQNLAPGASDAPHDPHFVVEVDGGPVGSGFPHSWQNLSVAPFVRPQGHFPGTKADAFALYSVPLSILAGSPFSPVR